MKNDTDKAPDGANRHRWYCPSKNQIGANRSPPKTRMGADRHRTQEREVSAARGAHNLLQIKLPEWTEDTEYQPNDINQYKTTVYVCTYFVGSRDDTQQFPNTFQHPKLCLSYSCLLCTYDIYKFATKYLQLSYQISTTLLPDKRVDLLWGGWTRILTSWNDREAAMMPD